MKRIIKAFWSGFASCLDLFPSGKLPKVKKIKLKTFADDREAMRKDWERK